MRAYVTSIETDLLAVWITVFIQYRYTYRTAVLRFWEWLGKCIFLLRSAQIVSGDGLVIISNVHYHFQSIGSYNLILYCPTQHPT